MSVNEQILRAIIEQAIQQGANVEQRAIEQMMEDARSRPGPGRGPGRPVVDPRPPVLNDLMQGGPPRPRASQLPIEQLMRPPGATIPQGRAMVPLDHFTRPALSGAPSVASGGPTAVADPSDTRLRRIMERMRPVSSPWPQRALPEPPAARQARVQGASDLNAAKERGQARVKAAQDTLRNTKPGSAGEAMRAEADALRTRGASGTTMGRAGRWARGAAGGAAPFLLYELFQQFPDEISHGVIQGLRGAGGFLGDVYKGRGIDESSFVPGMSREDLALMDAREAAGGGAAPGATETVPAPGPDPMEAFIKQMLAAQGPQVTTSRVPGGPLVDYPMQEFMAPPLPDYAGAIAAMRENAPRAPAPRDVTQDALQGIAQGASGAIGGTGSDVWLAAGLGGLGGRASGQQQARAEQAAFEESVRKFGLDMAEAQLNTDRMAYADTLGLLDRRNAVEETNIGRRERAAAQLRPEISPNMTVVPESDGRGGIVYRVQRITQGKRGTNPVMAAQTASVEDAYDAALALDPAALQMAATAALPNLGGFDLGTKLTPEQMALVMQYVQKENPAFADGVQQRLIIQQMMKGK